MAISTQGIKLLCRNKDGVPGDFAELCDIKSFPDMGAAPNLIEVTTLSDEVQRFIEGVKPMSAMEFTANYDKDAFAAIASKTGEQIYKLDFGTYGAPAANDAFYWEGSHSAWVAGGGVNAVVDMKISIIPSSIIRKTETEA